MAVDSHSFTVEVVMSLEQSSDTLSLVIEIDDPELEVGCALEGLAAPLGSSVVDLNHDETEFSHGAGELEVVAKRA